MLTIWKYQFEPFATEAQFSLPFGAEILHADFQGETVCVWARVDDGSVRQKRRFKFYGTGHYLDEDNGVYVSTIFKGPYVFHLFEVSP